MKFALHPDQYTLFELAPENLVDLREITCIRNGASILMAYSNKLIDLTDEQDGSKKSCYLKRSR